MSDVQRSFAAQQAQCVVAFEGVVIRVDQLGGQRLNPRQRAYARMLLEVASATLEEIPDA